MTNGESTLQLLLAKELFMRCGDMSAMSNSDFWLLTGMLLTLGGIGIWEGNELHPTFYSQSALIFGGVGYFAFKTFYADKKQEANSPAGYDLN
jgi:hypothetical protein